MHRVVTEVCAKETTKRSPRRVCVCVCVFKEHKEKHVCVCVCECFSVCAGGVVVGTRAGCVSGLGSA